MVCLLRLSSQLFAYNGAGTGVTTTLIALIANAAPEDQAMATAGEAMINNIDHKLSLTASWLV